MPASQGAALMTEDDKDCLRDFFRLHGVAKALPRSKDRHAMMTGSHIASGVKTGVFSIFCYRSHSLLSSMPMRV